MWVPIDLLFQLDPPPKYLEERIKLFDKLKVEYDAEIAGKYASLLILATLTNFV